MSSPGPFTKLVTAGLFVIFVVTLPWQIGRAWWQRIQAKRRDAHDVDQDTSRPQT